MTTFDVMVLAIVGFSTLFAFVRGVIRELIALIAWVIGLLAAVTFTPVPWPTGCLPVSAPRRCATSPRSRSS